MTCWLGSALALLLSPAWLAGSLGMVLDLLANVTSQMLCLAAGWMVVCLALRRWRAMLVAGLACVVMIAGLVQHRAAIWPMPAPMPRLQSFSDDPASPVRVLHYNARSQGTAQEYRSLIDQTRPDVISLLAPGVADQLNVIYGTGEVDGYPFKLVRRWKPGPDGSTTLVTGAYLVSRWPLSPLPLEDMGEQADHMIAGIVERPGAPFVVIAIHPRSPRNLIRWQEGNRTVEATTRLVERLHAQGLGVLVIADLNSTPTGTRCQSLCSGGSLRRCKPLLEAVGTYPETWPMGTDVRTAPPIGASWPVTLAIDDVWASNQIRVLGWSTLRPIRSEHRPIVVDLEVPVTSAGLKTQNSRE